MSSQKTGLATERSADNRVADRREEVKRLTIDISASLHTRLKVASAKSGQTMGSIMRACIDKYLNELGDQG